MESCAADFDRWVLSFRLEARLERGELLTWPRAPFALPADEDRDFLRSLSLLGAKAISYDPERGHAEGFAGDEPERRRRVARVLSETLAAAAHQLREMLPHYADALVPFRAFFHPEEQATRRLRSTARTDLLHVDAIRSTNGARLLRCFVNLHPSDPRVWATSDPLAKILPDHAAAAGLAGPAPLAESMRWGQRILRAVRGRDASRCDYDDRMMVLSDHLKRCDEFQDKAPRRIWRFAPGSAWLAFTDGLVHADLRGQGLIDCVFLVPPSAWTAPRWAPPTLLSALRTIPAAA